MGRTMLIVVILMSTIFAGIIISLQRQMRRLPDHVVRNLLNKEAENVSDYALRTAMCNAVQIGLAFPTSGQLELTHTFNNFRIGHCTIDSIQYQFVESVSHYRAFTYITAAMQGVTVKYSAEMAFNFPLNEVAGTPNCFFFEMDQPQFHGSNAYVEDSSLNDYEGSVYGGIGTSPHTPYGWKGAKYDGEDDYISISTSPADSAYSNLVCDTGLTLVVFATVDQTNTVNQGTLFWLASDPFDTGTPSGPHPGSNLRDKPTAAIWYDKSRSAMIFESTFNNGPKTRAEAVVPFTPTSKSPYNKATWHFFALTAKQGVLRAYINGVLKQTVTTATSENPVPNHFGVYLGRRDYRPSSSYNASNFKYFKGIMDRIGLFNRELSGAEINSFYLTQTVPENILYIKD